MEDFQVSAKNYAQPDVDELMVANPAGETAELDREPRTAVLKVCSSAL